MIPVRFNQDREAAGSSLTGVIGCGPCARHIYPSLVLVQPRKTCSCLTERLFMGRKESNQTRTKMIQYNVRGPKVVIALRSSIFFWPRSRPSTSLKLLRVCII